MASNMKTIRSKWYEENESTFTTFSILKRSKLKLVGRRVISLRNSKSGDPFKKLLRIEVKMLCRLIELISPVKMIISGSR